MLQPFGVNPYWNRKYIFLLINKKKILVKIKLKKYFVHSMHQ